MKKLFFLFFIILLATTVITATAASGTCGSYLTWTLDDEENWRKTHRLGGFIWSIGGLVMLISAFLFSSMVCGIILFAIMPFLMLVPIVYSYLLFRKKDKGQE